MTKKSKDVAERSERAGYTVKDHGHRFFKKLVIEDPNTGEFYLPDGYKFVEYLYTDLTGVWVILKDEVPNG